MFILYGNICFLEIYFNMNPSIPSKSVIKMQQHCHFIGCNKDIILFMKHKLSKSTTLPDTRNKNIVYAYNAIDLFKKGCYDEHNNLRIDGGFGDANMALFRLRNKRNYIRNVPTAFTPKLLDLLQCKSIHPSERGIASQHNKEIKKIIDRPKETYIQKIREQQEQQQRKKRQKQKLEQYKKGQDQQIRQFKQHLSFNYLPHYQANNWFRVKDNSSQYKQTSLFLKKPSTRPRQSKTNMKDRRKNNRLQTDLKYRTFLYKSDPYK